MKEALVLVCFVVSSGVLAQTTAFPDGSSPTAAGELGDFVKDKTFATTRSDGATGRFNFRSDSKFEIFYTRSGNTSKESGMWKAEDGKLCVDDPLNGKACNEARAQGQNLYYKRNRNGEVMTLAPQ